PRERDLAALYRVAHEISRADDPGNLFNALIDTVLEVTGATRGAVILPRDGGIEIAAARGTGVKADAHLMISRTITGETLQKGHSVLSGNAMADDRFGAGQSVILQKLRSVLCVPIESHERVLGAIYLDSAGMVEAFGERHLELVAAVGRQAGIALQRLRLIRDLENRVFGTVRSLVAALEAKDRYTRGHSERVGAFSLQIAHALDVPHDLWADIRLAGVLHDIGKIGIPEQILNKPAQLTDEEYALVKNHPSAGGKILEGIAGFETVRDGVRLHHERWDGKGYPEGRAGDATPLVARIVGIADAYDTMAYKRVYRDAVPKEAIVAEVRRCSGAQFDPAVAEAVCRLIEEERLTSPQILSVEVASREIADRGQ
ncbi:MAG: HD domain-containing protein, partial [Planctomycetes bacterium]|nr:HD domain-containing protein [Planctomycetota bacterium]